MTDWRQHLTAGLEIGAELVSGLEHIERGSADQEQIAEVQGMLADTIDKIARTTDLSERKRLRSTLGILRETIAQSDCLDQIVTAQALRSTAQAVADIALKAALELGAQVIEEA